jgi:hypothetical protein
MVGSRKIKDGWCCVTEITLSRFLYIMYEPYGNMTRSGSKYITTGGAIMFNDDDE